MKNFIKKIVLACLLVAILAPAQVVLAASFSDVPADHLNYDAVEYLRSKNIIAGYADGTFGPDKSITRAEATKIIDNAFSIDTTAKFEPVFSDVKEGKWFFPFVMAGKEAGFIKGYADGTFLPDKQVKLSETLKMALSAGKATLPDTPNSNVFVDVSEDNWVSPYALYAKTHNIILADKDGNISPDQFMTRGAFAEIIYRIMTVLDDNEKEFPLDGHWALYESPDLPFTMKYNAENWKIISGKHDVVFYNPDEDRYQFSPTKIYPNTGRIEVTLDRNDAKLTDEKYFENIEDSFTDAKYKEFKWNGFKALEGVVTSRRIIDWYIYLDSGYVLVVYTEYGNGTEIYRFPQIMKAMLSTFDHKDMEINFDDDNKELLNIIFKNMLVEKKGMDTLNLLPDKTIIETDAIGVGTGPVDYYYSEGVNYTFKYERKSDVILDKKVGKTSAF